MKTFDDIYELAANRKGGASALEKLLEKPKTSAFLRKIPDDRWLSAIVRSVFQAGFVWRIVEHKWPDFEQVFCNFDLHHVAYLSDEAIESLLEDARIIRHRTKLLATRDNAVFLLELANEHGSAANYFANYPATDYVDLLAELKKRGSRLGGTSAQYFLRTMGKESFILSRDVVRALIREKIVDRAPNSQRDLRATQDAFNIWCAQSKRSLTEVSRILAMGIES
ncbi:MAG: DNA-3-methyladenine glycosylase I [Proteobacteria bacterium]|nr:DNA-3-methyladenine glycosylase I [Pseudomonadota bacterium]